MSCEPSQPITIVRCPKCGSTNAGAVESMSAYDFTYMSCGECGYGGLKDHWQIKFDWNVEDELIGGELPEYLPPLPEGGET